MNDSSKYNSCIVAKTQKVEDSTTNWEFSIVFMISSCLGIVGDFGKNENFKIWRPKIGGKSITKRITTVGFVSCYDKKLKSGYYCFIDQLQLS